MANLMVLKHFMVRDIAFPMTEAHCDAPKSMRFGISSLATRILAVNILAIALMAAAFFYLDSFRTRLVDTRIAALENDMQFLGNALDAASPGKQEQLLLDFAKAHQARLRAYPGTGNNPPVFDSFAKMRATYMFRDPAQEAWKRQAARAMDRGIDWIVGAPTPQPFREPTLDVAFAWPEIAAASTPERTGARQYRIAPDLTPVFSVVTRVRLNETPVALMMTTNARDITRTVRAERLRLGIALGIVTTASILLSLFLARTIVTPLRRLAGATMQVKLGRARDVIVPRLPARRDEIGLLARALSDMTHTLRERIDAGEHFAADVAHELKNPIASLRSSLDTLDRISDPALRAQLLAVAKDDCQRLDRLVNDISEASRVDAQLSRTKFERIDLGRMIEGIISARNNRTVAENDDRVTQARIAFARPLLHSASVAGDGSRLERVFENLIDNALSFSPDGGLVQISAAAADDEVIVRIEDQGPGVAADQREAIFRRFHTERPPDKAFGKHSGLGLAIARTIIQGHQGSIEARDRLDGAAGACFEVRIPAVVQIT